MDEYARSRFSDDWPSAAKFASTSVTAAMIATLARQSTAAMPGAVIAPPKRSSAPKAPSFATTAMNAVDGVGADTYASGAQKWNGTRAALKASPASSSATPARPIGDVAAASAPTLIEPVAAYTSAMPYANTADAAAPSRKYFSALSS